MRSPFPNNERGLVYFSVDRLLDEIEMRFSDASPFAVPQEKVYA